MKKINFGGKKVTVVGLGESGYNAALLLMRQGAYVKVSDGARNPELEKKAQALKRKGAAVELGCHSREFIAGANLAIKSPGVRRDALPIQWARRSKIPVIGEIELGSYFCKADVIAVTGTNGKSTTATLIGEIFKAAKKRAFVCGNIGKAFCSVSDKTKKGDVVILEVSSFQLEDARYFRPKVALLLNISQNHLDRHSCLKEYINCKARVFKNQTREDYAILNYDDELVRTLKDKVKAKAFYFSGQNEVRGAFIKSDYIVTNIDGAQKRIMHVNDVCLRGRHNLQNVLACAAAGAIYGLSPEKMRYAISHFKGLAHRFEYIGSLDERQFINDSKATSVDAVRQALRAARAPVVLIAGGRDKNSDFSQIKDLIKERVKALLLIGEASDKIRASLGDVVATYEKDTLEEALGFAYAISSRGDTILLSPMCTSFDMFGSFEERGEEFKRSFNRLRQSCAEAV